MNKELKDYTTEELEARFDYLANLFEESYTAYWDLDRGYEWNNMTAIDKELGKR